MVLAVGLFEGETAAEVLALDDTLAAAPPDAVLFVSLGRHVAPEVALAGVLSHLIAHLLRGAVRAPHLLEEVLLDAYVHLEVDLVGALDGEVGVESTAACEHQEEGDDEDGRDTAPPGGEMHEMPPSKAGTW